MSENSSLEPDLNGLGQKNLIKLIKRANNYALLLLIEIQYSVVAMVVIGTPAIIYNNEKKSVLKNHSGLLKKKKKNGIIFDHVKIAQIAIFAKCNHS